MTTATAPRPRALVVFYSRSGNTRRVAEVIADELGADLEPTVDFTDRRGFFGYLKAGRDAVLGRTTAISPPRHDPAGYDLIVVGTPVWGSSVTPAIRTYLAGRAGSLPDAGLFITHGGSGRERVFAQLTGLCGRFPLAALAVREQQLKDGDWEEPARAFARELAVLVSRRLVEAARPAATG